MICLSNRKTILLAKRPESNCQALKRSDFNTAADPKIVNGDITVRDIRQIDRLDTPDRLEQGRGLTRPEFSPGVRIVNEKAPAIAREIVPDLPPAADRKVSAVADERNFVGETSSRAPDGRIATSLRSLAPIPAHPNEVPRPDLTSGSSELADDLKPVHNQNTGPNIVQSIDVASLAILGPPQARHVPEADNKGLAGESGREIAVSSGKMNAPNAAALNNGAAYPAPPIAAKDNTTMISSVISPEAEAAEPVSDDTIIIETRTASRSEIAAPTPGIAAPLPATMAAFAATAAAAERLAGEESFTAPVLETDTIGQLHSNIERAPIQFAPPTATAHAGAAWAQVISAISERNGETKLELRLNPPELGRVTIGFESDGGDLVRAVVSADSQQTLDLMRRNIDILQRELARSGLENINVELADRQSDSQANDANERTLAYASIDDAPAQLANAAVPPPLVADGRLDLRV